MRRRLPNRRGHELLSFEHGGFRYIAGIGRFDGGKLAEIFLNAEKGDSQLAIQASDSAILMSLLLQLGCPAETIAHSLSVSGVAAAVLDEILAAEKGPP